MSTNDNDGQEGEILTPDDSEPEQSQETRTKSTGPGYDPRKVRRRYRNESDGRVLRKDDQSRRSPTRNVDSNVKRTRSRTYGKTYDGFTDERGRTQGEEKFGDSSRAPIVGDIKRAAEQGNEVVQKYVMGRKDDDFTTLPEFVEGSGKTGAEKLRKAGLGRSADAVEKSGNFAGSAYRGAAEVVNVPGLTLGLIQGGEVIGKGAAETVKGDGAEYAEEVAGATGEVAEAGYSWAKENPAKAAGGLAGIAAGGAGAARVASKAGTASRAAGSAAKTAGKKAGRAAKARAPNPSKPTVMTQEMRVYEATRKRLQSKSSGNLKPANPPKKPSKPMKPDADVTPKPNPNQGELDKLARRAQAVEDQQIRVWRAPEPKKVYDSTKGFLREERGTAQLARPKVRQQKSETQKVLDLNKYEQQSINARNEFARTRERAVRREVTADAEVTSTSSIPYKGGPADELTYNPDKARPRPSRSNTKKPQYGQKWEVPSKAEQTTPNADVTTGGARARIREAQASSFARDPGYKRRQEDLSVPSVKPTYTFSGVTATRQVQEPEIGMKTVQTPSIRDVGANRADFGLSPVQGQDAGVRMANPAKVSTSQRDRVKTPGIQQGRSGVSNPTPRPPRPPKTSRSGKPPSKPPVRPPAGGSGMTRPRGPRPFSVDFETRPPMPRPDRQNPFANQVRNPIAGPGAVFGLGGLKPVFTPIGKSKKDKKKRKNGGDLGELA